MPLSFVVKVHPDTTKDGYKKVSNAGLNVRVSGVVGSSLV